MNTSTSAQLDILPEELAPGPNALREQAAERLAAHRRRRAHAQAAEQATLHQPTPVRHRGQAIAEAVNARFAQSQSYRAMLAEEAQRAIDQAAAAAEIAQLNAEAVVAALAAVAQSADIVPHSSQPQRDEWDSPHILPVPQPPVREVSAGGLTVRLYEDVGPLAPPPRPATPSLSEDSHHLDAEIAFRHAPVFDAFIPEAPHEPAIPIAANLLEFPRQLVAPKKQRPRLAEGPLLLEEAARNPQLRIFEVDPNPLPPLPEPPHAATEWSSIRLDAHTVTEPLPNPDTLVLPSLLPPEVAPMHLRLMAATVDLTLIAAGLLAFTAAAIKISGQAPTGPAALITAIATYATLYLLYQFLFFTLSGDTPGMRYARIGLCTFTDENPSRSAMRKRVLAHLIAITPLGLGILWALLDDDRLGWHDRISRMYQRAY